MRGEKLFLRQVLYKIRRCYYSQLLGESVCEYWGGCFYCHKSRFLHDMFVLDLCFRFLFQIIVLIFVTDLSCKSLLQTLASNLCLMQAS